MKQSGVYQIVNTLTRERYVGSSIDMRARWSKHQCDLRKNRHGNPNLQRAWDLYGHVFEFEVLLDVPDPHDLIAAEQHFIDDLKPEYNRSPSAGSNRGMSHTDEARANIGASVSGEKNAWFGKIPPSQVLTQTPESRRKQSESHMGSRNPMFGVRGVKAKLSDDDVRAIRRSLADGIGSQKLADRYGVSKGAIQHIKKGRSYRDVVL